MNSLVDFFKTEKGVDLEVLTTATLSKLEEIKEKTATGTWFAFSLCSRLLMSLKATQMVRLCQRGLLHQRLGSLGLLGSALGFFSGLSHIIQTRKVLDLRIDLRPSYLLLPKSGFYSQTSELIVIDFGSFQVSSFSGNGKVMNASC